MSERAGHPHTTSWVSFFVIVIQRNAQNPGGVSIVEDLHQMARRGTRTHGGGVGVGSGGEWVTVGGGGGSAHARVSAHDAHSLLPLTETRGQPPAPHAARQLQLRLLGTGCPGVGTLHLPPLDAGWQGGGGTVRARMAESPGWAAVQARLQTNGPIKSRQHGEYNHEAGEMRQVHASP